MDAAESLVHGRRMNGCASVLNTNLSNEITSSSEYNRYRYLSVSAMKKLKGSQAVRTGDIASCGMSESFSLTSP